MRRPAPPSPSTKVQHPARRRTQPLRTAHRLRIDRERRDRSLDRDAGTGISTQLTTGWGPQRPPSSSPDFERHHLHLRPRVDLPSAVSSSIWSATALDIQRLTTISRVTLGAKVGHRRHKVAYIEVTENDDKLLVVMDADGTDPQRVTPGYRFDELPAWTRDGLAITTQPSKSRATTSISSPSTWRHSESLSSSGTDSSDAARTFAPMGPIMTYASVAPGETEDVDLSRVRCPSTADTDIGDDVRLTTILASTTHKPVTRRPHARLPLAPLTATPSSTW